MMSQWLCWQWSASVKISSHIWHIYAIKALKMPNFRRFLHFSAEITLTEHFMLYFSTLLIKVKKKIKISWISNRPASTDDVTMARLAGGGRIAFATCRTSAIGVCFFKDHCWRRQGERWNLTFRNGLSWTTPPMGAMSMGVGALRSTS